MVLTAGDRLGAYEILGPLGAGGMGAVYRARDPRVGREVAIKVSKQRFTRHFEREARAIAALNHPNICALYDVGPNYLVMELVEEQLPSGPQPLPVVLDIARQLAEALEAAHERGIVHRDFKPGNIRITPRGLVKVLDFGLATTQSSGEGHDTALPPTDTLPVTDASAMMGTAAYMAPERVRGEPADRRADIWAYGVVLYELLTGRRPFRGESIRDVLTAIVHGEPDWTALPGATSPEIRRLLRRCIEKDPKKRLPDIGVARLEIDDAASPSAAVPTPPPRPAWWRVTVAATCVLAGALVLWLLRSARPSDIDLGVTRFSDSTVTALAADFPAIAVSPDGRLVVYATGRGLYVRLMSEPAARPISGTETMRGTSNPVFSPDGRTIAYFDGAPSYGGTIKTVAVTGGTPVSLRRMDFPPYGMSWGADGIVFGRSFGKEAKGVLRLSPSGGAEEMLIATGDEFVQGPQMLPDGRTVLFTLAAGLANDRWDKARIVAQSLTSGERTTLVEGGADGRYLPTDHILYASGNRLFAVPFDRRRLHTTATAVPVLQGVRRASPGMAGTAHVAVGVTGMLVYAEAPESLYDLALIDRAGRFQRLGLPSGPYRYPRASHDGTRIAVETRTEEENTIWVGDLDRPAALRRLTFGGKNDFPLWSSDGRYVVYRSNREGGGGIFRQRADGTTAAERLTTAPAGTSHEPEAWSPKGDHLLFRATRGSHYALWLYSLANRRAEPFGDVESSIPSNAVFSPDGQWVACNSRDADKFLISVQPFPATGTKYQVAEGGIFPTWSGDGRALFYFHGNGIFTVVDNLQRPFLTTGIPRDLWVQAPQRAMMTPPDPHRGYDPIPGGRFVSLVPADQGVSDGPNVRVVINWFEDLKKYW